MLWRLYSDQLFLDSLCLSFELRQLTAYLVELCRDVIQSIRQVRLVRKFDRHRIKLDISHRWLEEIHSCMHQGLLEFFIVR